MYLSRERRDIFCNADSLARYLDHYDRITIEIEKKSSKFLSSLVSPFSDLTEQESVANVSLARIFLIAYIGAITLIFCNQTL